jgi:hypothetical protein
VGRVAERWIDILTIRAAVDPGCVKTPECQKRGEWISQINQDWPRSEIVIALNTIRREICLSNFDVADFLHTQDPKPTSLTCHSITSSAMASRLPVPRDRAP